MTYVNPGLVYDSSITIKGTNIFFLPSIKEPEFQLTTMDIFFVYLLFTIIIVFFIFLVYLIYLRILRPARFITVWNYIRKNLVAGYVASGMPTWWVKFASTYTAIVIRYLGSICFYITRFVIRYNPNIDSWFDEHLVVTFFVYGLSTLFMVYTITFCMCSLYSVVIYIYKKDFIVRKLRRF